jgi:hypothetical protein
MTGAPLHASLTFATSALVLILAIHLAFLLGGWGAAGPVLAILALVVRRIAFRHGNLRMVGIASSLLSKPEVSRFRSIDAAMGVLRSTSRPQPSPRCPQ